MRPTTPGTQGPLTIMQKHTHTDTHTPIHRYAYMSLSTSMYQVSVERRRMYCLLVEIFLKTFCLQSKQCEILWKDGLRDAV